MLCPFHCVSNQTFLYCDPNDPNDIDLAVFHRIWPFAHQILPFPSRFKKIPSEFAVSHQIWPFSIKCGRFPMRFCRFSSNLSISHKILPFPIRWQFPIRSGKDLHQILHFSIRFDNFPLVRTGQTGIAWAKLLSYTLNWDCAGQTQTGIVRAGARAGLAVRWDKFVVLSEVFPNLLVGGRVASLGWGHFPAVLSGFQRPLCQCCQDDLADAPLMSPVSPETIRGIRHITSYPHPEEVIDQFNAYVTGPLRESVEASVGNEEPQGHAKDVGTVVLGI